MNTLDLLYKEILARPAEDTLRLAFADALEEEGSESSKRRAEFIRLQFELFALGKPRRKFEAPVWYQTEGRQKPYGVWFDSAKEDWASWVPGERVDVYHPGKDREFPGLRVDRVDTTDPAAGVVRVFCTLDGDSVPYPEERANELDARCEKLFDPRPYAAGASEIGRTLYWRLTPTCPAFGYIYHHTVIGDGRVCFYFERGFPSALEIEGDALDSVGDDAFRFFPVSRVELTSPAAVREETPAEWEARDRLRPYTVGGRAVTIPERYADAKDWGRLLSARWPTVPPGGWRGGVHFPRYVRSAR